MKIRILLIVYVVGISCQTLVLAMQKPVPKKEDKRPAPSKPKKSQKNESDLEDKEAARFKEFLLRAEQLSDAERNAVFAWLGKLLTHVENMS